MKTFLVSLIIPVNLSICLFIIGFVFALLKKKKLFIACVITSLVWVLAWSLPITSIMVGSYLERQYPHKNIDDIPNAQAIVVLGGHTANNRANWFESIDHEESHSRIDTAYALFFAGKAQYILLSGGALEGNISEAKGMAHRLTKMGVPPDHLILEQKSRTTHENGTLSQEVLQQKQLKSIILVTSALHMPRAMGVFSKMNLDVVAAPNPPQITVPKDDPNFSAYIPNYRALNGSRSIIKEYIGMLTYYLRGWI
ncbi:YdcF family protein [Brackiella oedipodis]|uniref:YdcF family protein n=1 Tax=Brackiella oedipodis TaxID=124225 RepID=UPI00048DCC5F|nr:YdcF family protein [Brackiella oedipodis]